MKLRGAKHARSDHSNSETESFGPLGRMWKGDIKVDLRNMGYELD
jgi:hypothetical protein